jgi:hypothetical protein
MIRGVSAGRKPLQLRAVALRCRPKIHAMKIETT